MRLIDADDLYQKCIEIQLKKKKRNRYFDIDDVRKLIKKAPTVDVLDKIREDIKSLTNGDTPERIWNDDVLDIIDKYKAESEDRNE